MNTVAGIFDSRAEAESALGSLRAAGIAEDASGSRDSTETEPAEREPEPMPPDDDEQPNASTVGLPPPAYPPNWVDHED